MIPHYDLYFLPSSAISTDPTWNVPLPRWVSVGLSTAGLLVTALALWIH